MKGNIFIFFGLMLASIAGVCQGERPIPRDTSYNPPHAWSNIVKRYPNTKIVPSRMPVTVKADRDLVYATLENTPYGKRDLHLDVFRPAKEGRYPAVVMVHGGAWRSGTKEMEHPMAQYAAAHGYVG